MSWRKIAIRVLRSRYLRGYKKFSSEEINELEEMRLALKQILECIKR